MPSKGRVWRGRETEFIIAEYLRSRHWPDAYATNKSAPGEDISNVGVLAIEAKATTGLPLLGALRQAHNRHRPGTLPVVIWRPNGYGEGRLGEWVVALRMADFFGPLAERAGYFQ